jgi:hypothetical protein
MCNCCSPLLPPAGHCLWPARGPTGRRRDRREEALGKPQPSYKRCRSALKRSGALTCFRSCLGRCRSRRLPCPRGWGDGWWISAAAA